MVGCALDSFNTFAFEESDRAVTLLFGRDSWSTETSGIYQVEDADTA